MEIARISKEQKDYKNLSETNLDWNVDERPLFLQVEDEVNGIPYYDAINSHKMIVREDNEASLGVVGAGYEIIQNSAIWEAFNESLAGIDYKITNAGHLKGGGKIFIQAEVGDNFRINDDKFEGYITMWSSHNGSSSMVLGDTLERVWCSNTFSSSLSGKNSMLRMRVRHTKNASIKFDSMMNDLDKIFTHRKEAFANIERLANMPISDDDARLFSLGFINSPKTRGMNTAETIHGLFRCGIGNIGETKYDLFNGFTEYYTHGNNPSEMSESRKNDQFGSSELGHGAKAKVKVLKTLSNPELTKTMINKGRKVLKDAEALAVKI